MSLLTCLFASVHESRVNWQLSLCVGEHKDDFRANFWSFWHCGYARSPTRCDAHSAKEYDVCSIGADPVLSDFNVIFFRFLFSPSGKKSPFRGNGTAEMTCETFGFSSHKRRVESTRDTAGRFT